MRQIAHWLEAYSAGETLDILCDLADFELQQCSDGRAAELSRLIRKGRFREVCDFAIDYTNIDVATATSIRQALAFFTKLEFLDIGEDKQQNAVNAFVAAETRCRETNEVFRAWHEGRCSFRPDVAGVFHTAQRLIAKVLGPVPKMKDLRPRFGPGATSLTKKREASLKRKLSDGVSCSEELLPWAARLLGELPTLTDLYAVQERIDEEGREWSTVPVVVHTGKVSFAKKNAKTYRATETQPTLNGMFQLAFGDYMSDVMRCIPGLDLSDQRLNQRLAKIGSLTGALATLDQRSASDCNAKALVASLLPLGWYDALNAFRVGLTDLPGHGVIRLEKFSAMGNGYTFPLESLIFWALVRACTIQNGEPDAIVSVYGDDIVVETQHVALVNEVLDVAGFWINKEKSYWSGPFRESCGADFLLGVDIRPVYIKRELTPADLVSLHNGLFRRGNYRLCDMVKKFIHPSLQLFGPDGMGDGHLICADWKQYARRHHRRPDGWDGWIFDTFSPIAKRDFVLRDGDRVLPGYTVYSRGSTPLLTRDPAEVVVERWQTGQGEFGGRFLRAWATGLTTLEEPPLPIPDVKVSDFVPVEETRQGGSYPSKDGLTPEWRELLEALGLTGWTAVASYDWSPEDGLPALLSRKDRLPSKATTFPGVDGYKKISIYTHG